MKKKLKIDMHTHSKFSPDSEMEIEKMVEVAKKKGLDGFAITDHNSLKAKKYVDKMKLKDFVILVGEEIDTGERNEIIAFEIQKEIPKKLGICETYKEIKKQKGYMIFPHTFDIARKHIGKRINWFESNFAIEVLNSRCIFDSLLKSNKRAVKYARKNRIPMSAGSDAHTYDEIGTAYLEIEAEPNAKAVMNAIKEGKGEPKGKTTSTFFLVKDWFRCAIAHHSH
ncbi:MAG: PHP domain-containing protein [Candidatus Diapherotrites archaeon]|nr:PHP domain-containing protein [Candidatus Diapherotrites archaeon]